MNMHSSNAATAEEAIAAQEALPPLTNEEATKVAMSNTLLTPRFYTTDFAEMDAIDVTPVRKDWDVLIAQMKADPNKGHFRKNEDWDHVDWDGMEPKLKAEFIDFLISSCTAEFSGCVLYKEMKRRGSNKDITELFQLMARDEARHAGFINDALREAGIAVNLGFLTQAKKYTYFRPKFIYYATYLSEKIGYARYITIYRQLEANPQYKFHPIFDWFEDWCNDEFRHGEAFALIMRADPKLLQGRNKLWIKFFQLAVFATMYVRDHTRPEINRAMGFDPTDYDYRVFDITTECCKQVFPVLLDYRKPVFMKGLERLRRINVANEAAKKQGGPIGKLKQLGCKVAGASTFLRLYLVRGKANPLPAKVRMSPTW